VPADYCFGLENFQRVQHIGCEAIEASEHEPIDVVEDEALGRLALQHIELMTKNENFSVQRSARPEQPGHKAPNQPADIAHNIEYHPIRRRSSAICVCGRDNSSNEIVDVGHRFFGTISSGLAQIVEKAGSQFGLPNGYVLGQEGGGAVVAGLRYGEGILYTKNAGDLRVFWQGPSLGYDLGVEGARTMMLVYNLPATDAIYQRFAGIGGSAYFVGGLGMTALTMNNIVVVPIRTGVGIRLGANVGYLKFTPTATWNPF